MAVVESSEGDYKKTLRKLRSTLQPCAVHKLRTFVRKYMHTCDTLASCFANVTFITTSTIIFKVPWYEANLKAKLALGQLAKMLELSRFRWIALRIFFSFYKRSTIFSGERQCKSKVSCQKTTKTFHPVPLEPRSLHTESGSALTHCFSVLIQLTYF